MKFSMKLLLCTMAVMAAALGFSGYYFVNYVFQTSLNREVQQALDENSILGFAFETAALNVPAKYDVLQDNTVGQIAAGLETGGHNSRRLLRLSDERRKTLYASDGFAADGSLLQQTQEDTRTWRVLNLDEGYYIQTGVSVSTLDRVLYLEVLKDVSEVFEERALGFTVYRRVMLLVLLAGALIMHLVSSFLTKPIRRLTKATEKMAAGDYAYRAEQVSSDELGRLTVDFNEMAGKLEENINRLEEELRSREDFVAAFAHELKTPLTSIIGYADLLRSRKLDEEKSFLSANYIYTEGKRLEAMSFRLLDIIVTRRQEADLRPVAVESLFSYLRDTFSAVEKMDFRFRYDRGTVRAEAGLIKTALVNLLDNACKASEPGSRIEVSGTALAEGYCFSVKDYGMGIPGEELHNITKAFYMVDKSRSRSRNGAGLGLALCTEILLLHGSRLKIESTPGEGTRISFVLSYAAGENGSAENGGAGENGAAGSGGAVGSGAAGNDAAGDRQQEEEREVR